MTVLEVAATDLDDALRAVEGGAQSLEVLRDLAADGLTPPLELVRLIRDKVTLPLNIMLRPHNNGFVYSLSEFEPLLEYIDALKPIGVQGVVFGVCSPDGAIDLSLMHFIAHTAAPIPLTLHRALDFSREPEHTLEALVGVIPRVLTAGPAPTAWEGREVVTRWAQRFGDHYRFASSGGLTLEQIPHIFPPGLITDYHFGGAARTAGRTDVAKVRQLRAALDQLPQP